ncbi:MAG: sulfotransferase [Pseudomonadales bacterium]|nr:sulfotransferase [Pseudomonadales bacterium]
MHLGHAWNARGDEDKASAYYRQLIDSGNDELASIGYWSLADQKGYRFSDEECRDLRARAEGLGEKIWHRYLLLFALARCLEQRGQYEEAFNAMRQANDQVAKERPFNAEGYQRFLDTLLTIEKAPAGSPASIRPVPIFVVGMPRTGSTLVEQILAAHTRIQATNELPFIEQMARQLDSQGGFAAMVRRLSAGQCRQGAEFYHERVKPFLRESTDYYVDKWPDNFRYVPLIKQLFADTKIINVIRDPVDNAIGVYKQYFNRGNEHSWRLDWIVSYWDFYLNVMNHWEKLYPSQILHVRYEDLARRPEPEIRRMLEYCGLPFESRCLHVHERDRPVMTPSSAQVRQPIYATSIGSGMRYREQLAPWLPALEAFRPRIDVLCRRKESEEGK